MHCEKCGKKLNDGDTFCFNCGEPVHGAAPARGAAYGDPSEQTVYTAPGAAYGDPSGQAVNTAPGAAYGDPSGQAVNTAPGAAYGDPSEQTVYTTPGAVNEDSAESAVYTAPAAYAAPPAYPAYNAGPPARRREGVGAAKTVLSAFLCLLLLIVGLAALILLTARFSLTEEAIAGTVESIDVVEVVEDAGLVDEIMDALPEWVTEKYKVNERTVKKLLESPDLKEFASTELSAYIKAAQKGDYSYTPSLDDIMDLLRANEDRLYKETGYEMEELDYDEIEEYIDDEGILEDVKISTVFFGTEDVPPPVKLAFSVLPAVVSLAVCAALLALLFVINGRLIRRAFLFSGIALAGDGLIYTSAALMLTLFLDSLGEAVGIGSGILASLASGIRLVALMSGVITLAFGAVLLVVFVIIHAARPRAV